MLHLEGNISDQKLEGGEGASCALGTRGSEPRGKKFKDWQDTVAAV